MVQMVCCLFSAIYNNENYLLNSITNLISKLCQTINKCFSRNLSLLAKWRNRANSGHTGQHPTATNSESVDSFPFQLSFETSWTGSFRYFLDFSYFRRRRRRFPELLPPDADAFTRINRFADPTTGWPTSTPASPSATRSTNTQRALACW